jgi:hypothetical protein
MCGASWTHFHDCTPGFHSLGGTVLLAPPFRDHVHAVRGGVCSWSVPMGTWASSLRHPVASVGPRPMVGACAQHVARLPLLCPCCCCHLVQPTSAVQPATHSRLAVPIPVVKGVHGCAVAGTGQQVSLDPCCWHPQALLYGWHRPGVQCGSPQSLCTRVAPALPRHWPCLGNGARRCLSPMLCERDQ